MEQPDGLPWSVVEVDEELDRLARQLRNLTSYKARAHVVDRADKLLDRRDLILASDRRLAS